MPDLPRRLNWLNLDRLARLTRNGGPIEGWETNGRCHNRGPTRFYPDNAVDSNTAKAWCAPCPARYACLATGIDDPHGIWGGTNRGDRTLIRRALNKRATT